MTTGRPTQTARPIIRLGARAKPAGPAITADPTETAPASVPPSAGPLSALVTVDWVIARSVDAVKSAEPADAPFEAGILFSRFDDTTDPEKYGDFASSMTDAGCLPELASKAVGIVAKFLAADPEPGRAYPWRAKAYPCKKTLMVVVEK